jgi:hypothetical protein
MKEEIKQLGKEFLISITAGTIIFAALAGIYVGTRSKLEPKPIERVNPLELNLLRERGRVPSIVGKNFQFPTMDEDKKIRATFYDASVDGTLDSVKVRIGPDYMNEGIYSVDKNSPDFDGWNEAFTHLKMDYFSQFE